LPVIPRIIAAAILVNIGMWFKRFIIIIPTLEVPLMPFEFGTYKPTWVEWSITAGAFAAFILVLAVLVKLIPAISIWEVAEEMEDQSTPQSIESGRVI
jgi:molybdopterin-containing oxidoreductase family membrane subunit